MENDTKKTDVKAELTNWGTLLEWLKSEEDEDILLAAIKYEIENDNRPAYIDRIRTRYNKVRANRELKYLEQLSGKTISTRYS